MGIQINNNSIIAIQVMCHLCIYLLHISSGFSNPVICSIESRARQEGFSPFGILLNEWGKRDNARVGQLIQALRCIHREDCVRILCGDNRDYVGAPKYLDLGSMHNQQIV